MKRLVIACLPGLNNFIDDVASALQNNFLIEKVYSNNMTQVAQAIGNADILWIEWANEMAAMITQNLLPLEKCQKVVLRLHSYEALNPTMLMNIKWGAITDLVFVSPYIKEYVNALIPQQLQHVTQHVIPNGLDPKQFKVEDYKYQAPGDVLVCGMLGHLNNKKGLMLLAQALHAITTYFDNHDGQMCHFIIGGKWQDPRYETYFYHFLEKMNLIDQVDFKQVPYGGANAFFQDIDVVLCTSPWESQNLSVMEGMLCGCKPAVHWFPGAEYHYPEKYLWTAIDELYGVIADEKWDPAEYRKLIVEGYNHVDVSARLREEVLS